jgi:uncharacterized protein with HEPN domain
MKQDRTDDERLQDILAAIDKVSARLPASRKEFDENDLLQYYLLKHVEIVGEAAYKLSREVKDISPHVPWSKVERTRHILVHDYSQVNWDILWDIMVVHLQPLRLQIAEIIESRGTH